MSKIFVLDTNVLLHDPNSIFAFKENEVIIPAVVLEEIDSKKRNADEIGRNARTVSRLLDGLRELGHLHSGVKLEHGGTLKVELNHRSFVRVQEMFGEVSNDNRILAVALNYLQEENEKPEPRPVVLVSKDVLVRIKADVLGVTPEDYLSDRTGDLNELYAGYQSVPVHPSLIDEYYSNRQLPVKRLPLIFHVDRIVFNGLELPESTRRDLENDFDLGFYPSKIVSFLRATKLEMDEGVMHVKLSIHL